MRQLAASHGDTWSQLSRTGAGRVCRADERRHRTEVAGVNVTTSSRKNTNAAFNNA
jgi:hypothetical protein